MIPNPYLLSGKEWKAILLIASKPKPTYSLRLAHDLGITEPHALRVVHGMKSRKFLTTKKEGRRNYIHLTEKGQKIAKELNKIMEIMKK